MIRQSVRSRPARPRDGRPVPPALSAGLSRGAPAQTALPAAPPTSATTASSCATTPRLASSAQMPHLASPVPWRDGVPRRAFASAGATAARPHAQARRRPASGPTRRRNSGLVQLHRRCPAPYLGSTAATSVKTTQCFLFGNARPNNLFGNAKSAKVHSQGLTFPQK